ncbi:MAG: metallophosphoesterase [Clostridiales bacterium]|nr:metallophosphoesterase [Clostridiales bacterium]
MIKLFVTGDIHIGKKYDSYPEIKERLIESRFQCVERCVKEAEREHCDFFVITGDLFDNVSSIRQQDVKRIVEILSGFGGRVLVLPGNHDYYTGEEKVWKDFKNALDKVDHNITLLTEFKAYSFETGEETVSFYPAFCQSKHSETNKLEWIRQSQLDDSTYHVGLAHGSIEGLSPDMKNEYFKMSERELNNIPVDAWLIGHTHIPYPSDLPMEKDIAGYKIFNAGTPEQTDPSNNTSGVCFILTLDRNAGKTTVSAHQYQSGEIRFFDIIADVKEDGLKAAVTSAVRDLPESSVIRLTVTGTATGEEYAEKQKIYDEALCQFLTNRVEDDNLSELITPEQIRSEFAEIGFAAQLLEALSDPKEIQMMYDLIKRYQEKGGC